MYFAQAMALDSRLETGAGERRDMELRRSALVAAPLGLALVLGSGALVNRRRDAAAMTEALACAAQLEQELGNREHEREPVGGNGLPGKAWDEYQRAQDLAQSLPPKVIREFAVRTMAAAQASAEERAEEAARLMDQLSRPIEAMRKGARLLDVTHPVACTQQAVQNGPRLSTFNYLTDTLTVGGLAAIEAGDPAEGSEMILDAMQSAQDLLHSPLVITQLIGMSQLVPRSLEAFGEHQGLARLQPAALKALDLGVAKLIDSAPKTPELRGEIVLFIRAIQSVGGNIPSETFAGIAETAELVGGCAPADLWAFALDLRERAGQVPQDSAASKMQSVFHSAIVSHRYNLVRLQMLHYAIREARGLDPEPFADPFGMPLKITAEGEHYALEVSQPGEDHYPLVKRYRR